MDRLFITLAMDLTPEAPEGPGWYVRATTPEQSFSDPIWISSEAAYKVASAFQAALQSTEGELPQITIMQLVESGTNLIRQATETALRYAEEQAQKVALLRRRLAGLPQKVINEGSSRLPQEDTQA